jgi:uncharacterized protein
MRSPWGDIRICDAHVHFLSHAFFASLGKTVEDWQMPPEDPARLAEIWASELDRHGVSRAALIASVPGDEASVAAAVARCPDRFLGYFMVNPVEPDAAVRVRDAFAAGFLQGICLFPAMHRYSMHDDRVTPLLELAAARPGTVVFVHCGVLTVGVRRKLGLPSLFDMRYSNPIDLHPIALRYPSINIVVPHFGAGYFREALMLCDLCPNVYLDTSSSNSWMRYEGLDLRTVFRRALEIASPTRLLFGSDSSFFPRGWHSAVFEAQSTALYELGASETAAEQIFASNLERLTHRA